MEQIHSGPMTGRTVLVTGGSGGIGRATALGLAAMGAHLAITGRDRGRTEDAAREIRAAGGQVDVFVADLSCQAQVRRLAGEVLQRLYRIDALVNNALQQAPRSRYIQVTSACGVTLICRAAQ
jgi:retinol dehydrogenase 14